MATRIIYPFGWLAGLEEKDTTVIQDLALEMLSHRSDLQETAMRKSFPPDPAKMEQAEMLEKYAVILDVIFLQMMPERWNPTTMIGIQELAAKHNITLPDWMKRVTT